MHIHVFHLEPSWPCNVALSFQRILSLTVFDLLKLCGGFWLARGFITRDLDVLEGLSFLLEPGSSSSWKKLCAHRIGALCWHKEKVKTPPVRTQQMQALHWIESCQRKRPNVLNSGGETQINLHVGTCQKLRFGSKTPAKTSVFGTEVHELVDPRVFPSDCIWERSNRMETE
eukprot:6461304-Amphidinium_carterae.1